MIESSSTNNNKGFSALTYVFNILTFADKVLIPKYFNDQTYSLKVATARGFGVIIQKIKERNSQKNKTV